MINFVFLVFKLWVTTTICVLVLISYAQSLNFRQKRADSNGRIAAIRAQLEKANLDGFIVTPHDDHQNSIVHPHDARLKFLTGFSGYFGDALVTKDKTVFWTDGRYEEQVKSELSSKWDTFITAPNSDSSTLAQWLIREFGGRVKGRIGADPKLVPAFVWLAWEKELENSNIELIKVGTDFNLDKNTNLVDSIWTAERPKENTRKAEYNAKYASKHWSQRIMEVRNLMKASNANAVVLTDMSEISWLFDVRAYDLVYPLVLLRAYVVIEEDTTTLFVNENALSTELKESLKTETCAAFKNSKCVKVKKYEEIFSHLRTMSQVWKSVWLPSRCGFTPGISMHIYDSIPAEKRLLRPSPIITLRSTKTDFELNGIRYAHVKDASATTQFLAYFNKYYSGEHVNWNIETSADRFTNFFYEQLEPQGIPLPINIRYADNPRLPCYDKGSCQKFKVNEETPVVNLRYSANYKDGTVDIGRTTWLQHFSEVPPESIKKPYTETLIKLIELAKTTFPANIGIDELQRISKTALVNVEYDDLRTSGHGFGHLVLFNSSLIPSPSIQYSPEACSRCNVRLLQPKQLLLNGQNTLVKSEKSNYWITIESIMEIVNTNKKDSEGNPLLGFEDISRVPYDLNLVDQTMLNQEHMNWLNDHNRKIRKEVLKEMDVRHWNSRKFYLPEPYLLERTRKLK